MKELNRMNRKTVWIVVGVIFAAAFLLGFVPQYLKGKALDNQLDAAHQQLKSERAKSQLDELGLLCGHVYLETSLKNYGLAGQYSTKFFDEVQAMMRQAPDSNLHSFLQETLAQRDAVTGGLAQGNPGTLSAVQDLCQHVLQVVGNGSK
jgi:hypothetical protein